MAQFRTYSALVNEINKRVEKAIKIVAEKMVEQLRFYLIEDFYNLYEPVYYKRTNQLRDDAPSYEMLSKNMAKIFIDGSKLKYRDATGYEVASMASLGFHGNINIFRPGFYWTDFVNWADKNVPNLLKEELKKQGLNAR